MKNHNRTEVMTKISSQRLSRRGEKNSDFLAGVAMRGAPPIKESGSGTGRSPTETRIFAGMVRSRLSDISLAAFQSFGRTWTRKASFPINVQLPSFHCSAAAQFANVTVTP